MREHAPYSLHDRSIHPLCKPVQIWGLWHCVFDPNTLALVVFLELPFVLATIVSSDNLQLLTRLSFDVCLELLEELHYLIL